jgi:hypothetical protein
MSKRNKDTRTKIRRPRPDRHLAGPEEVAALKATITDLVAKVNAGDRNALVELRAFLDQHPEIHKTVGDLTRRAEDVWLDLLVGDDVLGRESVHRELSSLKTDLTGEHPAALEKLLVDEISLCYLAQRQAQIAASTTGGSIVQAAFRLRRAESAQKRYLAAMKTLANLRALVPAGLVPQNGLRIHPESRKRA